MTRADSFILAVFFVAFASAVACANFPATREAGIRRAAEARVKHCQKNYIVPDHLKSCYAEAQAFCRTWGLEKTCGEGAGWTDVR